MNNIHPNVTIPEYAVVHDTAIIREGAIIGRGAKIGAGTTLESLVPVRSYAKVPHVFLPRWPVSLSGPGIVTVDRQAHTITEWLRKGPSNKSE